MHRNVPKTAIALRAPGDETNPLRARPFATRVTPPLCKNRLSSYDAGLSPEIDPGAEKPTDPPLID